MNVRPANIMILRTLKTRWCDNISYGGMPQHVREVTGGLTRLRFICDQYLGLEEAPGGHYARSGVVLR